MVKCTALWLLSLYVPASAHAFHTGVYQYIVQAYHV